MAACTELMIVTSGGDTRIESWFVPNTEAILADASFVDTFVNGDGECTKGRMTEADKSVYATLDRLVDAGKATSTNLLDADDFDAGALAIPAALVVVKRLVRNRMV